MWELPTRSEGSMCWCGFAVLPYSGTAPTVGFATLAADSNADATASASGREVLVTEVDATAKTVGVLF